MPDLFHLSVAGITIILMVITMVLSVQDMLIIRGAWHPQLLPEIAIATPMERTMLLSAEGIRTRLQVLQLSVEVVTILRQALNQLLRAAKIITRITIPPFRVEEISP